MTDSYVTPAELGYVQDLSTIADVLEADNSVVETNLALLGATSAMAIGGWAIAKYTEATSQTEMATATVGTGALMMVAYNCEPILQKFSWGRNFINRSILKAEEAKFASSQRQNRINVKNELRKEKSLIADMIGRTRAIHLKQNPIPGEVLIG